MIRCNRGSLKISQLETRQPMEEAGLFRRLFDKIKRVSKKKIQGTSDKLPGFPSM